jgi:hypothetical protein
MRSRSRFSLSNRGLLVACLLLLVTSGVAPQALSGSNLAVPLDPPRALYTIDCTVRFEPGAAVISGVEEIVLTNSSPQALTRLAFEWEPGRHHAIAVSVGGVSAPPLSRGADAEESLVLVTLPESIASGQELTLTVRFESTYTFEPEETKHLWTSWFPRIDWGVRVQDDFVLSIDYPTEYTFASSARHDPASDTWRASGVERFGLFLMRDAEVLEEQVGDVNVRVVHTPAGIDCARLIMETAVDVVGFYRDRFGFYPSDHIDILPGEEEPMGGYPAATSLVVIHGMERMSERPELHWRWITAHELGHQYWLEHVMSDSRQHWGWLMIGLGIWVDREYVQDRGYAPDKHVELLGRYTDGVRAGLDTRADLYDDYQKTIHFDFNNVVVHGKGFAIISALDLLIGDSVFDRIHSRSLKQFGGRVMNAHDFQSVCEEESGQDLDWFFDQWVRSSRFLSYEITSRECTPSGDGYRTEIRVARTGTLDMPVPVTVSFADGTEQTARTGRRQAISTLHFDSAAPLTDAVIDAGGELAMVVPAPSQEEVELRRKLSSVSSTADIAALPAMTEQALAMDIGQTLFWGQLGRKLYGWEFYEEALAVFQRRSALLEERQSEWVVSAYGWQGLLLDLLGRREEALAIYRKALEHDVDRDFAYDGDPVTIHRAWLQERLDTPFTRPEG